MDESAARSILELTETQKLDWKGIRRAFRNVALKTHPDKVGNVVAHTDFTKVKDAYEFLKSIFPKPEPEDANQMPESSTDKKSSSSHEDVSSKYSSESESQTESQPSTSTADNFNQRATNEQPSQSDDANDDPMDTDSTSNIPDTSKDSDANVTPPNIPNITKPGQISAIIYALFKIMQQKKDFKTPVAPSAIFDFLKSDARIVTYDAINKPKSELYLYGTVQAPDSKIKSRISARMNDFPKSLIKVKDRTGPRYTMSAILHDHCQKIFGD